VQDTVRGFVSPEPHRSHAALAGVKFTRRIRDQASVQPPPHRSDQHHAKRIGKRSLYNDNAVDEWHASRLMHSMARLADSQTTK